MLLGPDAAEVGRLPADEGLFPTSMLLAPDPRLPLTSILLAPETAGLDGGPPFELGLLGR